MGFCTDVLCQIVNDPDVLIAVALRRLTHLKP